VFHDREHDVATAAAVADALQRARLERLGMVAEVATSRRPADAVRPA
jgi:hypothetical protein